MTKNILAIAIAAAVMAPSAFAAATVYGVAHMAGVQQDSGSATGLNVASNSSRLGVKGSEDLGGGLKAVFQVEMAVGMDGEGSTSIDHTKTTGTTTVKDSFGANLRNSFAGVAGGFGTVLAGRHDSLIKMTGRKYDLFGDQVGNNRNILGGTTATGLVDGRHSNVLAYISPTWSGFHFGLAYIPSGATGDNEVVSTTAQKAAAYTALADYTVGAFSATLGYINVDNALTGAAATDTAFTATRLGAGYTFGNAKVVGLYQNSKATASQNNDVYGLGGSYKVGAAGTIKAQYYIAGNTAAAGADKNGASMTTVGYDHAMSKNTTVYAAYAMTDNDTAGAFSVNTASAGAGDNMTAVAGKDNNAFSVGLIHNF